MSRKADRQWAQRNEAILLLANGSKNMSGIELAAILFNGKTDAIQTEVSATRVRIANALVERHKAEQAQIADAMEIVGSTAIGSHADALLASGSKPTQTQTQKQAGK